MDKDRWINQTSQRFKTTSNTRKKRLKSGNSYDKPNQEERKVLLNPAKI